MLSLSLWSLIFLPPPSNRALSAVQHLREQWLWVTFFSSESSQVWLIRHYCCVARWQSVIPLRYYFALPV